MRRIGWFVLFWLAGVAFVGVVGGAIRWMLLG
jgi:hypothetical protein